MFGAALPGTFYKRDESLPPEMRYFDGTSARDPAFWQRLAGGHFTSVTETTEVAPGFHLIVLKVPGALTACDGDLARDRHPR